VTDAFAYSQANVDQKDIPQATAFQTFFQRLGGIIGVSIAGTVFSNQLSKNLDKFAPSAPKALLQASVEVKDYMFPFSWFFQPIFVPFDVGYPVFTAERASWRNVGIQQGH
jgi:hypothetical protein